MRVIVRPGPAAGLVEDAVADAGVGDEQVLGVGGLEEGADHLEGREEAGGVGGAEAVAAGDLVRSEAAEGIGEVLEGVVEFVAYVSDREAGAFADLIVFEIFVVLEGDEIAVGGIEFGDEELEGADGFLAAEGLIGIGRIAFPIVRGVDGGFAFVVSEVV